MAKTLLIVRGPLSAAGGTNVTVLNNPRATAVDRTMDIPPSLNEDDFVFTPPGSSTPISLKDYKAQEGL